MKWQNLVIGTAVLSLTLLALTGCGKAEQEATATSISDNTQTPQTTSTLQTSPSASAVKPSQPNTSQPQKPFNGTTPTGTPPSGMGRVPPEIDYTTAASKLGVTEDALKAALGTDSQKAPDLAAAAATLGVTEEALQTALGFTGGGFPGGNPPSGTPPADSTK